MYIFNRENTPRNKRENIESFLYVSKLTAGSEHLSITVVEVQPKGYQSLHAYDGEQMYYILEGTGIMTIEEEDQSVKKGECIFIPANAKHGIKNSGTNLLKYLSAASPSFSTEECKANWPLPGLETEK